MRAIPTRYVGPDGTEDFFRSRAEARWAVFFDTLGLQWRYEMQGFDLGDGVCYLPDFWLPEPEVWWEVKGKSPTDGELLKARLLCQQDGHEVVVAWSDLRRSTIGDNIYFWIHPRWGLLRAEGYLFDRLNGFPFTAGDVTAACSAARQARFDDGKRKQADTQLVPASQFVR